MPVPAVLTDLSVNEASNYPLDSDSVTATTRPSDYMRAQAALLRRLRAQGAAVASAATVDLGAIADGEYVHITGTVTITSFGTVAAGIERALVFDAVLTITHNATSLILPGATNIVTKAGDVAVFVSEGGGNWRCKIYQQNQKNDSKYVISGADADGANQVTLSGNTTLTAALHSGKMLDVWGMPTNGVITLPTTAANKAPDGFNCIIGSVQNTGVTLLNPATSVYSLYLPDGTTVAPSASFSLPAGAGNAFRLYEFANSLRIETVGKTIVGSSTANNHAVNQGQLVATTGASLIGTSQTSPSEVPYLQTVSDIINGERVSLFRFINQTLHTGLITGTDPNTDLTTSVQTAMDAADSGSFDLYVPPVKKYIRTTAPINITKPITICGGGWVPYASSVANTKGRGSWFYFDHTGIGFNVAASGNALMGSVMFDKIAIQRNQPTPAASWVPTANDYDIVINQTDVHINKVMLYNPTKGINQQTGNAGRLTIDGLFGQPMQIGINVDTSYDADRFNNIHFWPYWYDNTDVHAYTKSNLIAFNLLRCDNAKMNSIFTIFARYGVLFGASVNGISSRICVTNFGFDGIGETGIFLNSSANGTSAQFTNGYIYGADSVGTNALNGVSNDSASSNINLTNLRISQVLQQGIVNNGNSTIDVSGLQIDNWNVSNGGYNAVAGSAGKVFLHGKMVLSGGNGVDPTNNVNFVRSSEWITTFTPVLSATTGTLTTASSTFKYKVDEDVCTFHIIITITTNGTAAGAVKATVPIAPVDAVMISGREQAISGKAVVGNIPASGLTLSINNYDNTYPGSDGAIINISGSYRV